MQVQVIIPRFDNDGSDNADIIRSSVLRMCTIFGGATVYDAKGYWVSDAGDLYEDAVAVVMSAALGNQDARQEVRDIAREVLDLTDQLAVFVSVGGDAEIIE